MLYFTPEDGGQGLSFEWSDPHNEGAPVIDDIVLPDASTDDQHAPQRYILDLEVYNELEEPVEDVTEEIADQPQTHQFFFTGSAVQGPATGTNADAVVQHAYSDADADGLAVGLSNLMTTNALGSGELIVTLRHLAPENGEATKITGLAETVASEGFAAIGGDTDIQVRFSLTVQ